MYATFCWLMDSLSLFNFNYPRPSPTKSINLIVA